MGTVVSCIKAVLIVISGKLAWDQHKANNTKMLTYWALVTLYWTCNLLQGLIH